MKACMTYSTSTMSTTLGTDMSILVSKPTECAAECMIILSEFSFYVLMQLSHLCYNILYRLILIAEKETVYSQFPTPLVNRLEKHFVLMSSILEEWQIEVLNQLQNWIIAFSPIRFAELLRRDSIIITVFFRNEKFRPGHAFIGFQTDTPAAVIFQSSNFLRKLREQGGVNVTGWEIVQNADALRGISPEDLATLQEDSEQWKDAVK